jgi:ribosomal protein S18 acetylase RimI-like enzyme
MHITELSAPISEAQAAQVALVFESAFGHRPASQFVDRLNEKQKLLVVVAGRDSVDGFKIGYERFRGVFFSWLGGVMPGCRRQGIARALLREQHRICSDLGYREIQTETYADSNRMILLNLREGFEIYGTHLAQDGRLRVHLRKSL